MLSVSALDFINYKNALKGNYRKGLHTFRCILENPTQAENFATNLGGVCVVLGVPIGQDDRNSAELLALLLASDVVDTATLTWMSQWYADYCDDWDTLASDVDRCTTMAETDLMWRSVGAGPVGAAKVIATLAGLACADYADMTELAASSTAMAAVTASDAAMNAICASSMATAKYAAGAAGLDPADYDDMTELAASSTAMTAVAASSTAMTAVAASQTAMTAVAASQTAMAAVAASSTAMTAVAASSTAMTAVAASQTAMTAVAASGTARNAVYNSNTAKTALDNSPLKTTLKAAYSSQSNDKKVNLNSRAFILSTTGSGSGSWTFYDLYTPPTATSTTSKSMGNGNAFNLYLVGETITTQHGGGSASDYITIQYIPC